MRSSRVGATSASLPLVSFSPALLLALMAITGTSSVVWAVCGVVWIGLQYGQWHEAENH